MKLSAGNRLLSTACSTELIVVKADETDTNLTCGGAPMVTPDEERDTGAEISENAQSGTAQNGTLLGKRYVNESETLELLCTKAGDGSVGIDDTLLKEKESKVLPASD